MEGFGRNKLNRFFMIFNPQKEAEEKYLNDDLVILLSF